MKEDPRKLILPAEKFPLDSKRIERKLSQPDKDLLSMTFFLLDALCMHPKISEKPVLFASDVNDCFLLITTCRNQLYTLNAMYVEAIKWCQEAEDYKGYIDVIDQLRAFVSGTKDHKVIARHAFSVIDGSNTYLDEFDNKYKLYFERFDKTLGVLNAFCEQCLQPPANIHFRGNFIELENGPSHEDNIEHPPKQPHPRFRSLLLWYDLAKPLTILTKEFIQSLQGNSVDSDSISTYIAEIKAAIYSISGQEYEAQISWNSVQRLFNTHPESNSFDIAEKVKAYISFSEDLFKQAKNFLFHEYGNNDLNQRFPVELEISKECTAGERRQEQMGNADHSRRQPELASNYNVYLKNKEDIAESLERELERINKYRQKLTNADDPDREGEIKDKINRHKENLKDLLIEYEEVNVPNNNLEDVPATIKEQIDKIDKKVNLLCEGQEEILLAVDKIKDNILVVYEEKERTFFSDVLSHIERSNLLLINDVLELIHNDGLSIDEMKNALESIQEAFEEIKEKDIVIPIPEIDDGVKNISDAVNSPEFEAKHKLELMIPFIPGILQYKGEINLKSSINLEKAWLWLTGKFKKKNK